MVTIRISDEYLSELIPSHETHNLLHPLRIQFVEDVIEQKEWGSLRVRPFEEIKLRQFQCNHKSRASSDGQRVRFPGRHDGCRATSSPQHDP